MIAPHYSDDSVTLYRGDALAVLAALPDASVDAVVSDPPYSSGGMVRSDRVQGTHTKYVQSASSTRETVAAFTGDNRDQRAYAYWSALWMGEALRATKPGGVILAFTDWRQLPSTADAVQAGGWIWRGVVPWVKPTARPPAGRFTAQAEYVVWGSNGPMPIDYAATVLPGFYQASPPRAREHITQKPIDVMRSLVKICPEGGPCSTRSWARGRPESPPCSSDVASSVPNSSPSTPRPPNAGSAKPKGTPCPAATRTHSTSVR